MVTLPGRYDWDLPLRPKAARPRPLESPKTDTGDTGTLVGTLCRKFHQLWHWAPLIDMHVRHQWLISARPFSLTNILCDEEWVRVGSSCIWMLMGFCSTVVHSLDHMSVSPIGGGEDWVLSSLVKFVFSHWLWLYIAVFIMYVPWLIHYGSQPYVYQWPVHCTRVSFTLKNNVNWFPLDLVKYCRISLWDSLPHQGSKRVKKTHEIGRYLFIYSWNIKYWLKKCETLF